MVRALIFDWFGVCTTENWADCLARELSAKLHVDDATVRTAFKSLLQPFARAELSSDEFLRRFIGALTTEQNPTDFAYLFSETLPTVNEQLLQYIQKLRGTYHTYLLSNNFGPVFPEYEKRIAFPDYFDKLFLSHQLGVSKSQPEIWARVLPQVDCAPQDMIFIDNKDTYLAPAKSLGMDTILYQQNEQVISDLRRRGVEPQ